MCPADFHFPRVLLLCVLLAGSNRWLRVHHQRQGEA